ncbi:AlpA family phage regulatory protein [Chelatococcus sambhunathii]|uniref:AlpA family phage regulatory protein n=1 Tax=Chelatococcus sambhunathii TaxID=363953 RepID=A0ABU1DGE9_9HYPH|nr:AlpA family phage regulatory protein [Chelatococcus sambhunathii]MDR4306980.1 AlpA family phage regulatory protein [Chelatococcus sambhunathii]
MVVMKAPPELISVNEAARLVSCSRSMLFRLRTEGGFPKPVPIGARRLAFVRSEVTNWIANRIAERDRPNGGA